MKFGALIDILPVFSSRRMGFVPYHRTRFRVLSSSCFAFSHWILGATGSHASDLAMPASKDSQWSFLLGVHCRISSSIPLQYCPPHSLVSGGRRVRLPLLEQCQRATNDGPSNVLQPPHTAECCLHAELGRIASVYACNRLAKTVEGWGNRLTLKC